MQVDLVMTSIGDGGFLEAYREVLRRDGTRLIVIPDENTPRALYEQVDKARRRGATVLCPDLDEQESFLASLGAGPIVERRSDNRRNIGFLLAYRDGADALISLDDDNFPLDGDFVTAHLVVTRELQGADTVSSSTGWFDPCGMLGLPDHVYARGFPYYARKPAEITHERKDGRVAINAGLWRGDPDVDGATRLVIRPVANGYDGDPVVLAEGTWAPVNSQNTAVARRAIPCYFFPRMPSIIGGRKIDRYADILSGFFLQACAKAMKESLAIGPPMVLHRRNDHDVFADVDQELPMIRLLEDLSSWISGLKPTSTSYRDLYLELAALLDDECERWRSPPWSPSLRAYCHELCYLMRTWLHSVNRLA